MVTISYTGLLLTLIAAGVLYLAILMTLGALAAQRISRQMEPLERLLEQADRVAPRLERMTADAEHVLQHATKVAVHAEEIAGDIEALSSETRRNAVPLIRELGYHADNVVEPLRQVSAVVAGAKAGLSAIRNNR